jgi:hypothetical protein
VGIEPTGAAEGASIAVLKTGQTTRPDPPPSTTVNGKRSTVNGKSRSLGATPFTFYRSLFTAAITSISTLAPLGSAATATVERAGRCSPNTRE